MEVAGITRDMSSSGILVRLKDVEISSQLSRVGEVVRAVIDLPHSPHISPRFLECMAEVTRVTEAGPDECQMALHNRRTRVVDGKDAQIGSLRRLKESKAS